MSLLRFDSLLDKFLDETISADELDSFLAMAKEREQDILIQDVILEKLESGAYIGLGEQGNWRELYQQALLRGRQQEGRGQGMTMSEYGIGMNEQEIEQNGDVNEDVLKLLPTAKGTKWLSKLWERVAVAAFVTFVLGVGVYVWMNGGGGKQEIALVKDPQQLASYSRYVTLPDGSSVILNAGSTLEFKKVFNDKREVRLNGEAYFDIKKDADRPFIIYTGNIKTTVLGTAFNIRAYPHMSKIIVSVTSGKVKVEKGEKVLAVLDKDQQIVYNVPNEVATQEAVNAQQLVTKWTMKEMVFDEESFESVVELLSRRYGVTIGFKNPALKNCTIRASFVGTESLKNVLETLSTISNSTYIVENGKYVILGEGCSKG